jgi:two-component system response regulator
MTEIQILLVEDSPQDVEMTLDVLHGENLANQIHVARDGAEALDFLFCRDIFAGRASGAPKLVLLDLKLPKVSGLEVLRAMKTDPRTRSIPVVILTSSKEEQDLFASYHLGVNSYIQKPVDFDQFRAKVKDIGFYWLLVNDPPPAIAVSGKLGD